jgi:hypothetical protein
MKALDAVKEVKRKSKDFYQHRRRVAQHVAS